MAKIHLPDGEDWMNDVYRPYSDCDKANQIFYGGSSSGKTFYLCQRLIKDMLQGGRNYLVLRKVQRDCKKSVWNEVIKILRGLEYPRGSLYSLVKVNKSDMSITFPNEYAVFFGGLDDRERIKGITPQKGVITDIWMEEATEFDEGDYRQLEKRLRGQSSVKKRITMSFNPIIKTHWIYTNFFDNWQDNKKNYEDDRLSILKTTYRDNSFLTDDDIDRLESEDDPYYRDVYLDGNWEY